MENTHTTESAGIRNDSEVLLKTGLVAIREYVPGDRNFILKTFLVGLYYGGSVFSDMVKGVFMKKYHAIAEKLLDYPLTKIKICCLKEDPDTVLGYSIYRYVDGKTVLDFLYVKKAWRRAGIGKSLLPLDIVAVTHLTKVGKSLKPSNIEFDPFLI